MAIHKEARSARGGKRESYHHGDLRRDLVRVARQEIAATGAERVSLASLARLAGVAPSAPYRHFTDRRALLEAVAAEGFAELVTVLRDALAADGSAAPIDRIASAYVRFGEANIELYRLMFASKLTPDAADDSALDAAAGGAFGLLRTAVTGLSEPDGGGEPAVFRAWASVHGLVMLKADGFITSSLDTLVGPGGASPVG